MLVECCRYILIECPDCGKVNEYELNYFEFNSRDFLDFQCACGDLNGSIRRLDKERLLMDIHCIVCERVHIYNLEIGRLFDHNSSFSCQEGGRICLVGEQELCRKIKEKSRESALTAKDGLALLVKKLYTLDEANNILCSCGNENLAARICSDKLYLRCDDCEEEAIISIDSDEDLRLLLEKDKIVIGREKLSFY